jgi:hypothetical protein
MNVVRQNRIDLVENLAKNEESAVSQEKENRVARQKDFEGRSKDIRELEVARAGRRGDISKMVALSNVGRFAQHFEEAKGKGYSKEEAKKLAKEQTQEDIIKTATAQGGVASTLAKVGGARGATTGTDLIDIAKQTRDLNKDSSKYLHDLYVFMVGARNVPRSDGEGKKPPTASHHMPGATHMGITHMKGPQHME